MSSRSLGVAAAAIYTRAFEKRTWMLMIGGMDPVTLREVLIKDAGGTWFFLHVPAAVRQAWKAFEHRGSIKVIVTIGASTYDATLLPWADGSAQISVGKQVRDREGLREGDLVQASLFLRR